MIIDQFYLQCLAQASYLVADERTKTAAIIDPRRDVDIYLAEAAARGLDIRHVILTHFHADFVSGHLELQERTGATIHLGARGVADYAFEPLAEGDVIELGDARLEVLETPGHTPEGISLVAKDSAKGDDPIAVFTGDALFVGDVGRPDLMASKGVTAHELAGWLYDSLHGKLMKLPDATTVYPAHGAGSLCGKNLGSETFTTIGEQRRGNYALQPMEKEEFIRIVAAEQPAAPRYFPHSVAMNKGERALLEGSLEASVKPLSWAAVAAHMADGVQLLDVRSPDDFARGHVPGSLYAGLDGKFATWAGTVLDPARPVAILADPGREREAAMRLGRIGLDRVVGYLDGGIDAASVDLATLEVAEPDAVAKELADGGGLRLLDVRAPGEYANGHVEGALHIPLGELDARLSEVPDEGRLAVVCKGGYRSTVAAALLAARGLRAPINVRGGMDAWTARALPVEGAAGSCTA